MPCADQVPVKSTHSTMRWHKWVGHLALRINAADLEYRLGDIETVSMLGSSKLWGP
jgi:hypothetical protein